MKRASGRATSACIAACLAVTAAARQQPVFHSGVDAVVLEVSVLDGARQPVRNLTAGDFTVLEDGVPQGIRTFSPIELPAFRAGLAQWARTTPYDVRSNDLRDRRLIVILLDDAVPMPPDCILQVRKLAREVVRELGPHDLAAVIYPWDAGSGQDFTEDRALLEKAVDRFNNGGSGGPPITQLYRWTSLLRSLRGQAEALASLPQQRKLVILFSRGVPLVPAGARTDISGRTGDIEDVMRTTQKALKEAIEKAREANVTVYSVDPAGLETTHEVDDANRQNFLRTVADGTGGFGVLNTNDTAQAVTRIYSENAAYYVIGYSSSNRTTEGRIRKIQVRVNRPGMTVRAKNQYVEPRRVAGISTSRPSAAPVWSALAAETPQAGLPLRLVTTPFPPLPGSLPEVVVIGAVANVGLSESVPDAKDHVLDVLLNAYDMKGNRKAGTRLTAHARRPQGTEGESTFELLMRLQLQPGRYQVRLAAAETVTEKAGSVFCDLEVPDFEKNRLAISGIVISASPPLPAAPLNAYADLLPFVPTATRAFRQTDVVQALARISQRQPEPPVSARVSARIVDADGRLVFDDVRDLPVDAFSNGHVADVILTLPVAQLAEGSFLLSVEARAGSESVRQAVRFDVR